MRSLFKTSFPLLLDEYVMRAYAANFLLSLGAFVLLYIVFTFFELMGDIIRNQTPFVTVGEYLFNLIPYIVSAVTPLCSLLAVLITFGALNRSSELTAMKATGISLYRVVAPILVLAAILAAALFAFNESYLPAANRRQQLLRAEIKDKPAQTFILAGRKWISGQTDKAGDPERIFYYQAFDRSTATSSPTSPSSSSIPRPSPSSAASSPPASAGTPPSTAGSSRTDGSAPSPAKRIAYDDQPFTVATFPEIHEQPAYFNKEDKPSDEMSYGELATTSPTSASPASTPSSSASSSKTSSPSPPSPWSWPSSPCPSPSPWANAAALPASPPPSASPSPTGRRRHLQLHGQRQHPPAHARRLVPRSPLRHRRHLPPPPHPHLTHRKPLPREHHDPIRRDHYAGRRRQPMHWHPLRIYPAGVPRDRGFTVTPFALQLSYASLLNTSTHRPADGNPT